MGVRLCVICNGCATVFLLDQCSRCIPGVAYRNPFSLTGRCDKCPASSSAVQKFAAYLLGVSVFGWMMYGLRSYGFAMTAFSALIELAQLVSIIGTGEVRLGDDTQLGCRGSLFRCGRSCTCWGDTSHGCTCAVVFPPMLPPRCSCASSST